MLIRNLLREGAGVGILPQFRVRDELRDGALEAVSIDDATGVSGDLVALYPTMGSSSMCSSTRSSRRFAPEDRERARTHRGDGLRHE